MSLFSQRKGIRPLQKSIQRESMDIELKNRLWSGLKIAVYDKWRAPDFREYQSEDGKKIDFLMKIYWLHYFKLPIDTIPEFDSGHPRSAYEILREHFFKGAWWESYDFLEFTLKHVNDDWADLLKDITNNFLEAENAAYRFVEHEIVEITDENEIGEIESAINLKYKSIAKHLQRSLDLMSDKSNPDYRNSIKESISAVEGGCRLISGDDKATLGAALKKVDDKNPIHKAFKDALSKLYGYTSDQGGIRHSLTEEGVTPSYADAKFMLVACSSFINFLWTKAAENDIKIE